MVGYGRRLLPVLGNLEIPRPYEVLVTVVIDQLRLDLVSGIITIIKFEVMFVLLHILFNVVMFTPLRHIDYLSHSHFWNKTFA